MAEPLIKRTEPVAGGSLRAVPTPSPIARRDPVRQAYSALKFGFTVAPILAGGDKFFYALTDWDKYLAPVVTRVTGLSAPGFMKIAGVVEIAAGIGVAVMPKVFGYVVSAWLVGIIVNLVLTPEHYYDIALRDLGLSIGAFALAKLSARY